MIDPEPLLKDIYEDTVILEDRSRVSIIESNELEPNEENS